jgi:hypothetical protein
MSIAATTQSAALGADGLFHGAGGYTPSTGSLSQVDALHTATGD